MKRVAFLTLLTFVILSSIQSQEWLTNMVQAKEIASKENKPIILVFQGSDWCAPCMKLDKEIWNTTTFQEYAKGNYVMLQADFPRKKQNRLPEDQQKANAALAEKYNRQGVFPFVAILDSNGKVLGKTGYKKVSPEEYIKLINSFLN